MRIGPVTTSNGNGMWPTRNGAANRQAGGRMGRLSQNRLEAMNQIYNEANHYAPKNAVVTGTSNNSMIQRAALQRYHGALEEWQNYLNFKKQTNPAYSPQDGIQLSAVQDRLSMLTDVLSWVSDKINPSQPISASDIQNAAVPPSSGLFNQSGFTPPKSNPFSETAPNMSNPFLAQSKPVQFNNL